ncbi:hypothetical protein Tco_1479316 [Tanacetum coccineum]
MTSKAQQIKLDNALVASENRRVIGKCNMRINQGMKPKEPTYQVALDALVLTTCYPAFLITTEGFRVKNLMNPQLKRKLYLLSVNLVILEKSSASLMLLSIIYTNHGEPLHQSSTNVSLERLIT